MSAPAYSHLNCNIHSYKNEHDVRYAKKRIELMTRAFEGFLAVSRRLSLRNGKLWWPELAPLTRAERKAVYDKLEKEGRLASRDSR